ncbi:MAG: OsmC family peroxiredoxin [Candidatus Heimdallarchaeota archaeon]|nr:OsmC family peroxiredoxin [Candidatus Heimdallarchaeota archaeon]
MPHKTRTAKANWAGGLKEGKGTLSLESKAFEGEYNFGNRFGDDTNATNPEELIGAAHSGCYTMFLSSLLEKNGTVAKNLETKSYVKLEFGGEGGPVITSVNLKLKAEIPGITEERFLELAEEAKKGCPVSKALSAVAEMDLKAKLIQ